MSFPPVLTLNNNHRCIYSCCSIHVSLHSSSHRLDCSFYPMKERAYKSWPMSIEHLWSFSAFPWSSWQIRLQIARIQDGRYRYEFNFLFIPTVSEHRDERRFCCYRKHYIAKSGPSCVEHVKEIIRCISEKRLSRHQPDAVVKPLSLLTLAGWD